jgi:hypothetical protein
VGWVSFVLVARVDITVGPFATDRQCIVEYHRLGRTHRGLLTPLHEQFVANAQTFGATDLVPDLDDLLARNSNARCFMAIEIEGSGSRKHIMGGMINAAALGRLGVSLAASEANLRTFLRVRQCMLFLGAVGKNAFDPKNSLILTTHQFAHALGVTLKDV